MSKSFEITVKEEENDYPEQILPSIYTFDVSAMLPGKAAWVWAHGEL